MADPDLVSLVFFSRLRHTQSRKESSILLLTPPTLNPTIPVSGAKQHLLRLYLAPQINANLLELRTKSPSLQSHRKIDQKMGHQINGVKGTFLFTSESVGEGHPVRASSVIHHILKLISYFLGQNCVRGNCYAASSLRRLTPRLCSDQVSDAILDACLKDDPLSKVCSLIYSWKTTNAERATPR